MTSLSSEVELSVSCRNLEDRDVFSKSDPMVVMYMREFGRTPWKEIGRTETIWNNLNPDFVRKFHLSYFFEEIQSLKFEVYDVDSKSRNLSSHDFLGQAEITLAEIVCSQNLRVNLKLDGKGIKTGSIQIRAEEVSACKDIVFIEPSGRRLDKKDFFGKSDPYLEFQRCNEDGSFTVVHRTEVIKNTLNPDWKAFEISLQTLCNGDMHRTIKVVCNDWNISGKVSYIGEFETCALDIEKGGEENQYKCINKEKAARKKKYTNSGTIHFGKCGVKHVHSFLEYVSEGVQLSFVVAIDFTASNGDPADPKSLHYMGSREPNAYITALMSVGKVVEQYDTDKLFPVYGFGAKVPPTGKVLHDFNVNLNPSNPNVEGIDGIIGAYRNCISQVVLHGPTNFAPILDRVAWEAKKIEPGHDYIILLIITDGVITDMEQTKRAIVEAASLPLSIIIIGVGNANFDNMNELDGDEVRVSYRGQPAARDIVQFVALRDFLEGLNHTPVLTEARLAKEVLEEVPDQFLSYMTAHNIKPSDIKDLHSVPGFSGEASPLSHASAPPSSSSDSYSKTLKTRKMKLDVDLPPPYRSYQE